MPAGTVNAKRIYTKTGDGGMTATLDGRVSKADQVAVALGTIDELNSWIGVCRYEIQNKKLKMDDELRRMQKNLLAIGSAIGGSGLKITGAETIRLEKMIDRMTGELPKLRNFIYPTGEGGAAQLQVGRAVARRAEREVIAAGISDKNILKYMNRLSDALFVAARYVNHESGGKENTWRG
jgi:cob(I)alamin adenosyltransferase